MPVIEKYPRLKQGMISVFVSNFHRFLAILSTKILELTSPSVSQTNDSTLTKSSFAFAENESYILFGTVLNYSYTN